ncbi:MAG: hypothetical protein FWE50_00970 [Alphaproteobacteria bacterium]|nr:hypothetical protein [Alphaproteobacteria bacterium]
MKKSNFVFLIPAVLLPFEANADTNFYLGGTVGHHLYKESGYMQQAGYLLGAIVRFQHYGNGNEANLYLNATADYSHKEYSYNGSLVNMLTSAKSPYEFNGSQVNLGADAQVGVAFNFYELGDDYWVLFTGSNYKGFDDSNDKNTDYGHRRIRNSIFWTFGTKYIWKIGGHIITPAVKSGTVVYSRTVSKKDVDVVYKQKEGSLFEFSVSYEYGYFWLEPYFKYQQFGNSERSVEKVTLSNGKQIEIEMMEPANITRELGINIGARF